MNLGNTKRTRGMLLILGSFTVLVTIYFEYQIGWLSPDRNEDETINFIYERWSTLKLIWGVQMVGQLSMSVAFLLFTISSSGYKRLVWSILFLSGVMMVSAFGIVLVSYYPALEVYNTQPQEFENIRAMSSPLYRIGRAGALLYMVVFLWETYGKTGTIDKQVGSVLLAIIAIAFTIGFTTRIPIKLAGAVWFLLPFLIGYYYFRTHSKNNIIK